MKEQKRPTVTGKKEKGKEIEITKIHPEIRQTKAGKIVKFTLETNAGPYPIYSQSENQYGLEQVLKQIEKAKQASEDTIFSLLVITKYEKSIKEYIEDKSKEYQQFLINQQDKKKNKKKKPKFIERPIFHLVRQKALKELFESAKNTQKLHTNLNQAGTSNNGSFPTR